MSRVRAKEEVILDRSQMETSTEVRKVLSSHLFSLPASLSGAASLAGIGYSVFTHGNLNRGLEMKSPPPSLSLGPDGLRGDAANQGMGPSRINHNSAVSSVTLSDYIKRCHTEYRFVIDDTEKCNITFYIYLHIQYVHSRSSARLS